MRLLLACFASASACTIFAAGRGATKDGSVIVSHSDDGDPSNDARIVYVPAADYAPNATRNIYYTAESFPRYVGDERGPDYKPTEATGPASKPIGSIPQVAHTFGYQDSTYGVINEHNVAVAESTCSAVFMTCAATLTHGCEKGRKVGAALMSIDTLSELAMERSKTAREAVELMGSFAEKYGFYGPGGFEGGGESLMVADPTEVWVFNILADSTGTGAIWAAKRVPDDHVTVGANMFTIREVNTTDTANCLASKNVYDVAEKQGWWKKGEVLDFTRTYSDGEYAHQYYSGRRMWRGFQMAAPSVKLSDTYDDLRYNRTWPWSVKPDQPVTHHDFMRWHRDYYVGTQYDMTKGVAAGPFGSPDRYSAYSEKIKGSFERSIALYRTNMVYVQHLREATKDLPKELAGVAWMGPGAAHYAPFIPLPSGVNRSIDVLKIAMPKHFSTKSLNWAVRKVMDLAQIRFDKMHPLVEKAQLALEAEGDALMEFAAYEYKGDKTALTVSVNEFADKALRMWQDLADEMVFAYSDNSDIIHGGSLGYSDAWLKAAGFENGPPPPPEEKQCPPLCPGDVLV